MLTEFAPLRVLCWFSCGAASAVATKLAIEKYGERAFPVYCDTSKNEHPDNQRFLRDVEQWLNRTVLVLHSDQYDTVESVFDKRAYMSGPKGACCTVALKKVPRFHFQEADDVHIFGYTKGEEKRVRDLEKENPELFLEWILIDAGYNKQACLDVLKMVGIKLPEMYRLGYKHNNCLGCVKATSPRYWNQIRRDFPDVFARRAEQSRRIGCKLVRIAEDTRIYLDELDPQNEGLFEEDLSCGPQCSTGLNL